jgi:hypothetical protein
MPRLSTTLGRPFGFVSRLIHFSPKEEKTNTMQPNGHMPPSTPGQILRAIVDFLRASLDLFAALDRDRNPAVYHRRDAKRVMQQLPGIIQDMETITRRVEAQERGNG